MPVRAIYLVFFLSGISGLIYQVVWVRWFGRLFGNTVYSASLVIAVFMCGLGVGSYLVGIWIDRRHSRRPTLALTAYGYSELAIAGLGLVIAFVLPVLEPLSAYVSFYAQGSDGWYELSSLSLAFRFAIAVVILAPITLLMGGTLALLIRALLATDTRLSGWRIGFLYGFNTAGAALGAISTDFALVPALGLLGTQMLAVFFNLVAALAALRLVRGLPATAAVPPPSTPDTSAERLVPAGAPPGAIVYTGLAIFLSGFFAMGAEILWFRHFTIALGGHRAVFSLLLTVILVGIWLGSVAGGYCHRRFGRPALLFMVTQTALVVLTVLLLAKVRVTRVPGPIDSDLFMASWVDRLAVTWGLLESMIVVIGLPAVLMGFAYPLANANIQRATRHVGRRAGLLYLTNTIGAVLGSLCAGFWLLPALGIKGAMVALSAVGALAVVALFRAARAPESGATEQTSPQRRAHRWAFSGCAVLLAAGIGLWTAVPNDRFTRFGIRQSERLLTTSEGVYELIAVTEAADGSWRKLNTNGHPMSGNSVMSQRYMRAFVHLPLLHHDDPKAVLVICFGVGTTAHAATLYPSIDRIDIADLSRNVLAHADYFRATNRGVLDDPRVSVFVNDGRQHLWMQPPGTYDLITLEPPPLAHAGVSALYSREFYQLARSRLREGGLMSQWLPAYQLPEPAVRSMVRAFVDVFPNAVLLSGHRKELILVGAHAVELTIDPAKVAEALRDNPRLAADLEQVHLATVTEILGTFFASAPVLIEATKLTMPLTDDYPIMEYAAPAANCQRTHFPIELVNVDSLGDWCPLCFASEGGLSPEVGLLAPYLVFMDHYYRSADFEVHDSCPAPRAGTRLPISRSHPVFRHTTYLSTMLEPEGKR